MNTITINFTPCTPAPANGYRVSYRPVGTSIPYRVAPNNFTTSPAVIQDSNDPDGTQYEGFIESDCGGGNYGVQVPFNTGGGTCANVTGLQIVSIAETSVTLTWNTVPNAVAYTIYAVRVSDGFQMGNSTGGNPPRSYTGLTAGTDYKFYVKTHCQNGGTSSGVFIQGTTTQQQYAYYVEAQVVDQSYYDYISCGCNNPPAIQYPHDQVAMILTVKDNNGNVVTNLPIGVSIAVNYRQIGTDLQGNAIDQVVPLVFSGNATTSTMFLKQNYSECDNGYQSCLDFHILQYSEEYIVKEFSGNVPVIFNPVVNDWSNAYQQGGNGGWIPATYNIGNTDIRGLLNFQLQWYNTDNIIQMSALSPQFVVFTDTNYGFAPLPAGAKIYTDNLLTTPLLGVSQITVYLVGNNTNIYAWWATNLNPATGEVV